MDRKKDNRKKNHKIKINKLHIIFSLVAIILIILMLPSIREKIDIGSVPGSKEKELESIGSLNIKWNDDMDAKSYKGNVIVDNKKNITSYDLDNEKLWSRDLKKSEEAYLGDTGFFINNTNDKNITKFDKDGKDVWSYKMKGSAYTMTEIEDYLLVYSKVDENTRSVSVLDEEGKLLLEKEKDGEEILSANISKNGKRLVITSINTSSPDLKSKITYVDKKGETVWTEDVDGKIIYNVLFTNKNEMLLIGEKDIICKDNKGKTLWDKEIEYNLKDVKITKDKEIAILYGIETSYLEGLNIDGELSYKKTFKEEYNEMEEWNKNLLLMGTGGVVGLKNEEVIMKNDISLKVKEIEITEDEILIATDNKIEIFKIVNKD